MTQRILYLSFDGLTDPLGQSQILPYLVGLAKLGHQIDIVALEKPDPFARNVEHVKQVVDSAGLRWIPIEFAKRPPILAPWWNLWRMRRKAEFLFQERPYGIIHCRSYMTALVGRAMKPKYGCSFLFDMRGFWADERVEGGLWNLANPLYKLLYLYFKHMERCYWLEADTMVSLTHRAKAYIEMKEPSLQTLIKVVPCCADLERFTFQGEDVRAQMRDDLGFSADDRVLVYVGSLGTWYCLEEMLDFFAVLRRSDSAWKFLFVTQESPEAVLATATSRDLASNVLVRSAASSEVARYLSVADLAISFIKPSFSKMASSPTKVGEMLGVGLPIVSNSGVGDMDSLHELLDFGPLVRSLNQESYSEILPQLDRYLEMPRKRFSELARQHLSLEHAVSAYREVYETAIGPMC